MMTDCHNPGLGQGNKLKDGKGTQFGRVLTIYVPQVTKCKSKVFFNSYFRTTISNHDIINKWIKS